MIRHFHPSARLTAWLLCLSGLWLSAAQAAETNDWRAEFAARLAASESPTAQWGIEVVSLDSGRTLFETNAHKLFIPASNAKLFTVALALDRLGGDFRIKTSFMARREPDASGTLSGDLVVLGRGDPTFFSGLGDPVAESSLGRLAEAVIAKGVRRIDGDLVCDEGYFRGPPYGAGWAWDDLGEYYGVATSALSLNDNVVRLRSAAGAAPGEVPRVSVEPFLPGGMEVVSRLTTGAAGQRNEIRVERLPGEGRAWVMGTVAAGASNVVTDVSVPSPAGYLGEGLRRELLRRGVKVSGQVRVAGWRAREESPLDAEWRELGAVHSPSLGELARPLMKPSNNLHAQLFWLQVGAETENYPSDSEASRTRAATTSDAAQRALNDFLGRIGIPSTEVNLIEGAGLARADTVTPAAFVQLLRFMDGHAWANAWKQSLPIGGRDGTLQNRFTDGPARERVLAKTGSLRQVATLSGYVTSADGGRLAFSILVNGYTGGAAKARGEIDRLVQVLAGRTEKSVP